MTVLFGHPAGNPNSHHAALAHFEAGCLEAFCVPWMPSPATIRLLARIGPLRDTVARLARREFSALAGAPKVQGRISEWCRLLQRGLGRGDERLSYEANDWLMEVMRRECRRPAVTAVHAYEDCSLLQFEEARRLGKACVYDMPIGYYPAWEKSQEALARQYAAWIPAGGLSSNRYVRAAQKRAEMGLADLVLAPSAFVERTIMDFHSGKNVVRAPYGVDTAFWHPSGARPREGTLRLIYAGQLSLRKGIPLLLEAWEAAALPEAELELVGLWQLAEAKRAAIPRGVRCLPPQSPESLRERYWAADAFVFPSYFEGFGLVLLEAMACGLPAIASDATAGPDVLAPDCGSVIPAGNLDALVESLASFGRNRQGLARMGLAARAQAERCTWENYRRRVTDSVAAYL